jgi:hypothetical protein
MPVPGSRITGPRVPAVAGTGEVVVAVTTEVEVDTTVEEGPAVAERVSGAFEQDERPATTMRSPPRGTRRRTTPMVAS